jgi:hypothetical protein
MSKADFAAGQINAHLCLLRAMIEAHPKRDQLREAFEMRSQVALAATVPSTVSEDYMQGFQHEVRSLWVGLYSDIY